MDETLILQVRCDVLNIQRTLARFAIAAILLPAATLKAQWRTPWSYEGTAGPDHWAALDPAYAACNGAAQSPIDIRSAEKANLPALQFDYRSEPLQYLINNGYTIRVNYHDAPDQGNFLIVGDQRYQLTQFHFHRPSEERIGGKGYDMVAHLVHQSADGKSAVVAVMLKTGAANSLVAQIWEHMPKTKGGEEAVPGVTIDPAALLPRDRGYYTYVGSLTAPPCTEGITWYILKTPVEVSADQIKAFAALYPNDARPLQPVNGRVVRESR
jgi:carbonic anhydrase